MEDSDSEYETEEAVILLELNGIIDPNFLLQKQTPVNILGIETEQPILQMGKYVFTGHYEDTLGTVVAYESTEKSSDVNENGAKYKFCCKTDKKLSMTRAFLKEKESVQSTTNTPTVSNVAKVPVNGNTAVANIEVIENGFRTANKNDLEKNKLHINSQEINGAVGGSGENMEIASTSDISAANSSEIPAADLQKSTKRDLEISQNSNTTPRAEKKRKRDGKKHTEPIGKRSKELHPDSQSEVTLLSGNSSTKVSMDNSIKGDNKNDRNRDDSINKQSLNVKRANQKRNQVSKKRKKFHEDIIAMETINSVLDTVEENLAQSLSIPSTSMGTQSHLQSSVIDNSQAQNTSASDSGIPRNSTKIDETVESSSDRKQNVSSFSVDESKSDDKCSSSGDAKNTPKDPKISSGHSSNNKSDDVGHSDFDRKTRRGKASSTFHKKHKKSRITTSQQRNLNCEVSQSSKNQVVESSEVSNECEFYREASDFQCQEIDSFSPETHTSICVSSDDVKTAEIEVTSENSCKVSQSSNADNQACVSSFSSSVVSNFQNTNECDVCNQSDDADKNLCGSSGDAKAVPEPEPNNSNCEVTQSYKSDNVMSSAMTISESNSRGANECEDVKEDSNSVTSNNFTPCVSSNFFSKSTRKEETNVQGSLPCEVSQSSKTDENTSVEQPKKEDSNECEAKEASSNTIEQQSSEFSSASTSGTTAQPSAVCEATQSCRSQVASLLEESAIHMKDEVECSSHVSENESSDLKELCESSDDIVTHISSPESAQIKDEAECKPSDTIEQQSAEFSSASTSSTTTQPSAVCEATQSCRTQVASLLEESTIRMKDEAECSSHISENESSHLKEPCESSDDIVTHVASSPESAQIKDEAECKPSDTIEQQSAGFSSASTSGTTTQPSAICEATQSCRSQVASLLEESTIRMKDEAECSSHVLENKSLDLKEPCESSDDIVTHVASSPEAAQIKDEAECKPSDATEQQAAEFSSASTSGTSTHPLAVCEATQSCRSQVESLLEESTIRMKDEAECSSHVSENESSDLKEPCESSDDIVIHVVSSPESAQIKDEAECKPSDAIEQQAAEFSSASTSGTSAHPLAVCEATQSCRSQVESLLEESTTGMNDEAECSSQISENESSDLKDPCESSDDVIVTHVVSSPESARIKDEAECSSQISEGESLDLKDPCESSDDIIISASDQISETNNENEIKCEVSQSYRSEGTDSVREIGENSELESNEAPSSACEDSQSNLNTSDGSHNQIPQKSEVAESRNLSCEVSQSEESGEQSDICEQIQETNECEVFENPLQKDTTSNDEQSKPKLRSKTLLCEVTQSSKDESSNHSYEDAMEIENNECTQYQEETYSSSNNPCVSSDDVRESIENLLIIQADSEDSIEFKEDSQNRPCVTDSQSICRTENIPMDSDLRNECSSSLRTSGSLTEENNIKKICDSNTDEKNDNVFMFDNSGNEEQDSEALELVVISEENLSIPSTSASQTVQVSSSNDSSSEETKNLYSTSAISSSSGYDLQTSVTVTQSTSTYIETKDSLEDKQSSICSSNEDSSAIIENEIKESIELSIGCEAEANVDDTIQESEIREDNLECMPSPNDGRVDRCTNDKDDVESSTASDNNSSFASVEQCTSSEANANSVSTLNPAEVAVQEQFSEEHIEPPSPSDVDHRINDEHIDVESSTAFELTSSSNDKDQCTSSDTNVKEAFEPSNQVSQSSDEELIEDPSTELEESEVIGSSAIEKNELNENIKDISVSNSNEAMGVSQESQIDNDETEIAESNENHQVAQSSTPEVTIQQHFVQSSNVSTLHNSNIEQVNNIDSGPPIGEYMDDTRASSSSSDIPIFLAGNADQSLTESSCDGILLHADNEFQIDIINNEVSSLPTEVQHTVDYPVLIDSENVTASEENIVFITEEANPMICEVIPSPGNASMSETQEIAPVHSETMAFCEASDSMCVLGVRNGTNSLSSCDVTGSTTERQEFANSGTSSSDFVIEANNSSVNEIEVVASAYECESSNSSASQDNLVIVECASPSTSSSERNDDESHEAIAKSPEKTSESHFE